MSISTSCYLWGYLVLCVSGLWKELENMPEIMSSRNKLLKSSISHQRQDMRVLTVNAKRIVHTRAKRNTTIAHGWVGASPNYTEQSCGYLLCVCVCVCVCVWAEGGGHCVPWRMEHFLHSEMGSVYVCLSQKLLALEVSSVLRCDAPSLDTTQPATPCHILEDVIFSSTTAGTPCVGNNWLWW